MHTLYLAALLSAVLAGCAGPTQGKPAILDLEPRPVAVADDPVNKLAISSVDGLVLALTIDGSSVQLDSAIVARVPSTPSQRGGAAAGDRVTVVGFADGVRVSESSASDAVLNAQEEVGLVRLTKRQVVLSLPAPRAIDTVEVRAPATGASARFDVRAAYAPYCKGDVVDKQRCPSRSNPESVR